MVRVARLVRACAWLLLAVAAIAIAKPSTSRWIFIDLGTLSGGYGSYGSEVNNRGDIAGSSLTYYTTAPVQDQEVFVWSNGAMRDIGKPPGSLGAIATAMNEKGEICGEDAYASLYTWRDGTWSALGFKGQCFSMNNAGDIVGSTAVEGDVGQRAYLYRNGVKYDLGTLGGRESRAEAINERGQIVGFAMLPGEIPHVVLWQDGAMNDLGTFGGTSVDAIAINNNGTILLAVQSGVWVPVVLGNGVSRELFRLQHDAIPRAMNDRGEAVGILYSDGHWEGWHWFDGALTNLDQLPSVRASGFSELAPADISERGWIVGTAYTAAHVPHAFLLVPRD